MPRTLRVDIEGGLYHVFNRVVVELHPFEFEDEGKRFIELLQTIKGRDGWVIYAWCLLPNHFHFAIRTRSVRLWRSMRSLQHRFALGFNRRHDRQGPVWRGRYRAKLVKDPKYLNQLMAYIHLNPVKAGLAEDPADYRWSGHAELVRKVKKPVVDVDHALMGFGSTLRSARAAYVRSLRGDVGTEWFGEDVRHLPWWQKPDDREIQTVDSGPYIDVQGRSTGIDRPRLTTNEYLEVAAQGLGVELQELAGRGRKPDVVRVRELVAVLGVERYGVRVAGLAAELGKSRAAVSRWVRRGAAMRARGGEFARSVGDLDRHVASKT